jgi:hypothetical protein
MADKGLLILLIKVIKLYEKVKHIMTSVGGEGCCELYYLLNLVNSCLIFIANTISFHMFSICKDAPFSKSCKLQTSS